MQHIQWFPGHMAKAVRMMEDNLKLCDGAVYVLDSRAAFACINYKLLNIFNNKPVLFLLNKSDMIESADLLKIVTAFKKAGKNCLATVGTSEKSATQIREALKLLFKEKTLQRLEKGIVKPIRVMVCGIPNTGKSTVINALCGKKQAQTGDKAGVTKGKQWLKIEKLELLDTPGTMPPSFSDQIFAMHLAFIGSINDEILDVEDLCFELIKTLNQINPDLLKNKYGIESDDTIEAFNEICFKRGYVMRGNEPDYLRCARAVIDDLRKGKIGKVCFETEGKIYGERKG